MPLHTAAPSQWFTDHCPPCPTSGRALDLACGKGRHSFWLARHGWQVTALDRDLSHTDCAAALDIDWITADLEAGTWPLGNRQFDLIVVINYLHRPLFPNLKSALKPGGILIYETFMMGNEAFGRPRSPDFLLDCDELITVFDGWKITAQMQGPVLRPGATIPHAVKQAIVAQKP